MLLFPFLLPFFVHRVENPRGSNSPPPPPPPFWLTTCAYPVLYQNASKFGSDTCSMRDHDVRCTTKYFAPPQWKSCSHPYHISIFLFLSPLSPRCWDRKNVCIQLQWDFNLSNARIFKSTNTCIQLNSNFIKAIVIVLVDLNEFPRIFQKVEHYHSRH